MLGAGLSGLHLGVDHSEADADAAGDLAEGLAFGPAGEDCAALVVIDYAGTSASASAAGGGL